MGFLKKHPSYALLTFAQNFSLLGTTLTTLVVCNFIENGDASVTAYAMVYVLSVAPGVLLAHFSHLYRHHFSIGSALIVSTVFSLFALSLTWYGCHLGSIALLLCSELGLSLVSGFLAAYNSLYDKVNFQEDKLEEIASVDTITFGVQTIFGLLLGTLLLAVIKQTTLSIFDGVTFLSALVLFVVLNAIYRPKFQHRPRQEKASIKLGLLSVLQNACFGSGPYSQRLVDR